MTTLCLVVALACEARPWIDHYRLRAVADSALRIWRNEDVSLVVSGIGSSAAAMATGYLAAHSAAGRACGWLNVGIAGHGRRPPGDVVRVETVARPGDASPLYASLGFPCELPGEPCISVDAVERDYHRDALYDMECHGFFSAASRLAWLELVQSVKVVSDGPGHAVEGLDRAGITRLVGDALPRISTELVEPLHQAARMLSAESALPDADPWLARWHFTVTHRRALEDLLRDWRTVHGVPPSPASFAGCRGARQVLTELARGIDGDDARGGA